VKLHRAGKLKGVIGKSAVTAEQMEISRLRAEFCRALHLIDQAAALFPNSETQSMAER
jgi:hypothetical protein